jgi:hypothetical protein
VCCKHAAYLSNVGHFKARTYSSAQQYLPLLLIRGFGESVLNNLNCNLKWPVQKNLVKLLEADNKDDGSLLGYYQYDMSALFCSQDCELIATDYTQTNWKHKNCEKKPPKTPNLFLKT